MIQALNDKVMLRLIKEEKKESVIEVVEVRKDSLLKGEVVSVPFITDSGVGIGDMVLFSSYGYEEYEEYVIVTNDMLYARISTSN